MSRQLGALRTRERRIRHVDRPLCTRQFRLTRGGRNRRVLSIQRTHGSDADGLRR